MTLPITWILLRPQRAKHILCSSYTYLPFPVMVSRPFVCINDFFIGVVVIGKWGYYPEHRLRKDRLWPHRRRLHKRHKYRLCLYRFRDDRPHIFCRKGGYSSHEHPPWVSLGASRVLLGHLQQHRGSGHNSKHNKKRNPVGRVRAIVRLRRRRAVRASGTRAAAFCKS